MSRKSLNSKRGCTEGALEEAQLDMDALELIDTSQASLTEESGGKEVLKEQCSRRFAEKPGKAFCLFRHEANRQGKSYV